MMGSFSMSMAKHAKVILYPFFSGISLSNLLLFWLVPDDTDIISSIRYNAKLQMNVTYLTLNRFLNLYVHPYGRIQNNEVLLTDYMVYLLKSAEMLHKIWQETYDL